MEAGGTTSRILRFTSMFAFGAAPCHAYSDVDATAARDSRDAYEVNKRRILGRLTIETPS